MSKTKEINQIFCIGPFNTGTNLLQNIISNADCISIENNKLIKLRNIENEPWIKGVNVKHCFSRNVLNQFIYTKNMGVIILYKNVYNWIYSIKKEPYEFKFNKIFDTVIIDKYIFKNIIETYNLYYTMYMNILEKNSNVVFVDYYKLINNETCFDYLNHKLLPLGIKISNKEKMMEQLNKPAKQHGMCIQNSLFAVNQYISNQELVQNFIIKNTNLSNSINNQIIHYFENDEK